MQVKAVNIPESMVGFYDDRKRKNGDIFELHAIEDFSHKWMEAVDFDPPPPKTSLARTLDRLNVKRAELDKIEKQARSLVEKVESVKAVDAKINQSKLAKEASKKKAKAKDLDESSQS